MPLIPLPDPEDPDWAEIMYELLPDARPPPPVDYFVIDLTRKGCGIRGFCQAEVGWKPKHKYQIRPSTVQIIERQIIDLTGDD